MLPAPGAPTLALTPQGHLWLAEDDAYPALPPSSHAAITAAFAQGTPAGLLHLGASEVGVPLPPTLRFWRDFAAAFVTALAGRSGETDFAVPVPDQDRLEAWLAERPPMRGGEYLTPAVLTAAWMDLEGALRNDLAKAKLPLQDYLQSRHPAWNLVGRVYFNLAENRNDPEAPFAFLATFASQLSSQGKPQHVPLSRALDELSGAKKKAQLLSLLLPVQRASETCAWLRELVEEGDIYHPLRWTPAEALQLLRDIPALEAAGLVVRTPGGWQAGRPARPMVRGRVGSNRPSTLGLDALVDFAIEVTLEGESLDAEEIEELLKGTEGLRLVRGRWVEIDRDLLGRMLDRFRRIETLAAEEGLRFGEAMRLLAGANAEATSDVAGAVDEARWSEVTAGPWLSDTLRDLRSPGGFCAVTPGEALHATLRPYQQAGLQWLYLLTKLGLGACLADDMGLGKTIQILALLLVLKGEEPKAGSRRRTALLVAPASLLGNWAAEAARFAPSLRVLTVHPSMMDKSALAKLDEVRLGEADLVLTSYGTLLRASALSRATWGMVVADEAQALKNPAAKQTKQAKALRAATRIALTGTPVENRLGDLWSLFDFTHPGLLGSAKTFLRYAKRLEEGHGYGPLRKLTQPYLLRRMKSDKSIIADLPDKTELVAWCSLSPVQAALYQQAVAELAARVATTEGVARRGLVLASLTRLKQICNHPSQWLGDGRWREADSGKLARLREIAETIGEKQEKMLLFTQFRETCEPLAAFLGGIFGRPGLVLHGETPVGKRRGLVKHFQEDERTPFFVLSLKAGGSGLNLTAASHVVHFDRWWNPSVENQATDRAFRIGQRRNVLVHKLVCRGTVEERVDQLIASKQKLVSELLEGGAELRLTELDDRALLDLVALDWSTLADT